MANLFCVVKNYPTRSFIRWTYHYLYNQFPVVKHWCHLNSFHYFIPMLWTNILIAELLSRSVIFGINFWHYLNEYFFSAILTVFIKESLSPRLTPLVFDKHFGVAMPIQVLLSLALCLPWLNLLWVVDISEGHSANQRSRKNFLSSQSQQSFSLKISNLLCSSIPPFAD